MVANTLRWILHWFGQGLKLWIFAFIATLCLLPIKLPLGPLEEAADHSDELGLFGKIGTVAGHIACFVVGIAVFTAVLASQLKDTPLRSFIPNKNRENESDDDT